MQEVKSSILSGSTMKEKSSHIVAAIFLLPLCIHLVAVHCPPSVYRLSHLM